MIGTILTNEPLIRGAVFALVLVAMAVWEIVAAIRPQRYHRRQRWPGNLLIVLLDTLLVRMVFPFAAIGVALMSVEGGWGLFNWLTLPNWVAVLMSIVVLDLTVYFQHRLFHAIPWLWRLHRMHHADLEFDVTTGLRFHPLEILISMGIKLTVVAVLGAPALAVLIFEVVLNSTSMFNHGNVHLPAMIDRWVRQVIVTPDMHRVHHSILRRETNSNFGFNLSWWDRLFGTYIDQPAAGHLGMTIGIEDFRDAKNLRLDRMLIQPFVNPREK